MKILVVEDNADQRELIHRAFEKKVPDARLSMAENASAALAALQADTFDAVILDYSLPKTNGLELLGQIQSLGVSAPVIMVTGQGDERIAVETMKSGAYDYVLKTRNYHDTMPILVQKVVDKFKINARLQEASQRTRRLYDVSLAITKERKVEILIQQLAAGSVQLVKASGGIVLLTDPQSQEIPLAAVHGIDLMQELKGPLAGCGLWGLALTEGEAVVVEDPASHPLWEGTPGQDPSIRQILTVPLVVQEKMAGALVVINKEDRQPFSQEDIDSLSTLAVHAAVAIDNASRRWPCGPSATASRGCSITGNFKNA